MPIDVWVEQAETGAGPSASPDDYEGMLTMRFMLLLKGDPQAGQMPSKELINRMGEFNAELVKAGVLLAAEGLHPSANGAQVVYSRSTGRRTVVDGPFAESKELVAGFYLIQVASKEEAVEWASRCPVDAADLPEGYDEAVVEVRQVAEMADFPDMTDEQKSAEQALRDQLRSRPE